MAKRKLPDDEGRMGDLRSDQEEAAPDSGGQSGDDEGLSDVAEANEESVKQLVDTDQAYEAEIVEGVEEAGDNPEKPVPDRERRIPERED